MTARLNHFETTPTLTKALMDASMAAYKTSIDPLIKSLIDIRASQLNRSMSALIGQASSCCCHWSTEQKFDCRQ